MGVSAIGSAFSYIPPERVAQSEPSRSRETATADPVTSPAPAGGSSTNEPSGTSPTPDRLAPDTRSSLLTEQETSQSEEKPVSYQAASRAYGASAA